MGPVVGKMWVTGRQPLTVKCYAAGGSEKEKERKLELQCVLQDRRGSDL